MSIHPITLSTHAQRLERWLGAAEVERLSTAVRPWYGPGIPVANVPGRVVAMPGGDFRGVIRGGRFSSLLDYHVDRLKRIARSQLSTVNTGFASWSDLISEGTAGGKMQPLLFTKVLPTQTVAGTHSAWQSGPQPAAGGAATGAPGGRACSSSTTGAMTFVNPSGSDTLHYLSAHGVYNSGNAALLLLYDRLWDFSKFMSSSTAEAVDNSAPPTRYQSTSSGADYIGGNFLFPEVQTTLSNTAHNWTVCKYTNQAGTAGQSMPSAAGIGGGGACAANRLDLTLGQWFMPLATGDTGIQLVTQLQCDNNTITGNINFVLGHPIAFMPLPVALLTFSFDGVGTAFNPARIFNSACLAFLNILPSTTTAPTISGVINTCAG